MPDSTTPSIPGAEQPDPLQELGALRARLTKLETLLAELQQTARQGDPGRLERLEQALQAYRQEPLPPQVEAAAPANERMLRNIVEFSPDGIVMANEQGQVVEWNPGAEQLTGIPRTQALGRPLWELQSQLAPEGQRTPAARQRLEESLRELLRTGRSDRLPPQSETEITRPDGARLTIQSVIFIIQTERGNWVGSILRDITERAQYEEALRRSRERLALALRGANDGLWDWDLETDEVYFSPRWKSMLGYADHEVEHHLRAWERLVDPEDLPRTWTLLRDYLDGKTDKFECEFRMRHKAGHAVDVLSRAFALRRSSDGKPLRVIGTHVDITARKLAEQSLRESRRLLYTVVNSAPITLFALDCNGVFTLAEGQAPRTLDVAAGGEVADRGRIHTLQAGSKRSDEQPPPVRGFWPPGYHTAEVVGQSIFELYKDVPQVLEHVRRALHGEAFSETVEIGSYVFEVHYSPLRDQQGDFIGVVGVSTDITQRVRAQEALHQAKLAAEAASHAKSAFLANMSHELRTPLNGILGYAQILRSDESLSERQRESIQIIARNGEHLLTLVNDILDLSKVEAGKMEPLLSVFHLPHFLESIVQMFELRAAQKGIEFEYRPLSALPGNVRSDEKRLRQVLINLLGNAVKFTYQGKVMLEVGYHFDKLRFQVVDTGIGIHEADLQAIFEPFQQASMLQGTPGGGLYAEEGTGLGLSISHRLVELLGGELQVQSTFGRGSTFWFDLDLPAVEVWSYGAEQEQRITGYEGRRRVVLVVDDVPTNRALIADMLAPLGFELLEAGDGDQAVQMVSTHSPDLVLLDLVMPVVNGFEAARRIRRAHAQAAQRAALRAAQGAEKQDRDASGRQRPVIITLSASAFGEHRRLSLEAGCDGFLARPFGLEALLHEIQAHLGLQWIYEKSPAPLPSPPAYVLPPQAALAELLDLAQQGKIVEFNAALDRLKVGEVGYDLFVMEMRALAQDFKLREIRRRLQAYQAGPKEPPDGGKKPAPGNPRKGDHDGRE
jgi:PAS domain S-box-containing protein